MNGSPVELIYTKVAIKITLNAEFDPAALLNFFPEGRYKGRLPDFLL